MKRNITKRDRGSTLVLIVVITIVLLLVVGFLVFRVGNLTGSQREAQTAIDAAALQAAKEVSQVTVSSSQGTIGAIDLPPGSPAAPNGAIGINTALATARLDALIANDIGNSTMQFLAARDIDEIQNTIRPALISAIQKQVASGSQAYQNIMAAYNNNGRRGFRNDSDQQAASRITITLGGLTGTSTTNLRVPNGADPGINNTTASNGFYNAYTPVSVPGLGKKVYFSAVGDQPRIVDNARSRALAATDLPTLVQVATDTLVQDTAPGPGGTKSAPRLLHNLATAVCGGSYIASVSTTYCVSFAGGFPPNSAPTVGNSFDSVVNILNTSVLSASGSSQGSGPWGPLPARTWFRAPENGSIPPGPPVAKGFPGAGNQTIDVSTPSVALAFGIYDWMRSLGLRVNHTAMVAALSDNLRSHVPANPPVGNPIIFTGWRNPVISPAYAAQGNTFQQNSCWLALPSSPNSDSRQTGFATMNGSNSLGAQMVANAFGYAFASTVCPAEAAATQVSNDGATTIDGNDIAHLADLQNAVLKSNHAGECARDAGASVQAQKNAEANQLLAQQAADQNAANTARNTAQSETSQANALTTAANASNPPDQSKLNQAKTLLADADTQTANASALDQKAADEGKKAADAKAIAARAGAVNATGKMVVEQTYATQSNFQALTGLGVKETDQQNFTLAGSAYAASMSCAGDSSFMEHPSGAQLTAMKNAILQSQSDNDPKLANGNGNYWSTSGWKVYTHATAPVISHDIKPMGMPSAYAQSAVPPNNNLMFLFNIQGNYQDSPGGTSVSITPLPLSPFLTNVTAKGQCHYLATGSLTVTSNGVNITFSTQARDEVAVGQDYVPGSNQSSTNPRYCHSQQFNMNLPDKGGNDCPTLGGEWRLGCPVPGGCVSGSTVGSNGSLTVTPCPPPPAVMG